MTELFDLFDATAVELALSIGFLSLIAAMGIPMWLLGGIRYPWVAVPAGAAFGLLTWLFGMNAFGHVTKGVESAAWISAGIVLALGVASARYLRHSTSGYFDHSAPLSRRGRRALIAMSASFAGISTFITLRVLKYDDEAPSHIPAVLSMLRGDFPPVEPSRPSEPFNYHYLPDLLPAALSAQFGLPPWWGYDLLILAFSVLMVPLAFALVVLGSRAVRYRHPVRLGLLASLLAVAGNGWQWTWLFRDGETRRAIADIPSSPLHAMDWLGHQVLVNSTAGRGFTSAPILNNMHTKSAAVGFVGMLLIGICYYVALTRPGPSRRDQVSLGLITAISIAAFALAAETYLAVTFAGLAVLTLATMIRARSWAPALWSGAVTLGGLAVASVQGGVLTVRGDVTTGGSAFVLSSHVGQSPSFYKPWIPAWSSDFLVEWLPLLLVALPAMIVLLRRGHPLALATVTIGAIGIAIPLVLEYQHHPPEIIRFFPLGTLALAVFGAVTIDWLLGRRRILTLVGLGVASSVLLTSVLFTIQSTVIPLESSIEGMDISDFPLLGHPEFDEATFSDIARLRELPAGARVASAMNRTNFYSGVLPVMTTAPPEYASIQKLLVEADPAAEPEGYDFDYAFCVSLPGTDCSGAFAAMDASDEFEVLYERYGPPGDAKLYRINP